MKEGEPEAPEVDEAATGYGSIDMLNTDADIGSLIAMVVGFYFFL